MNDMILGLNRPQYVASPELLLVALAHSVTELVEANPTTARIYKNDRSASTKLDYVDLYPSPGDDDGLDRWAAALDGRLVASGMTSHSVARAVTDSLLATRAPKAKGQAAVPFGQDTALLQDVRGMLGAASPPNYAKILEQFYRLGGGSAPGVAARWAQAAKLRQRSDPLVGAIERAVGDLLPPRSPVKSQELGQLSPEWFQAHAAKTPMGWFAETWARLTSDPWVEALPARRWVDWAATVLRLGIGFGYLWEARWFDGLAGHVLRGDVPGDVGVRELDSRGRLMSWGDAAQQPSVRDVHRSSRSLVLRGMKARDYFDRPDVRELQGELAAVLNELSEQESEQAILQECLQARTARRHENVWETVRYALASREGSQLHADHYGLLHGRGGGWSVVAPGTEWLAVVASLTCREPGESTTAAAVWESVRSLGLAPSLGELVRLLEWAGLARQSADADQAVTVVSAF